MFLPIGNAPFIDTSWATRCLDMADGLDLSVRNVVLPDTAFGVVFKSLGQHQEIWAYILALQYPRLRLYGITSANTTCYSQ